MSHFKHQIMKKILVYILSLFIFACSLEEEILDEYQRESLLLEDNIGLNLIAPAYARLHLLYNNEEGIYILNEGCSDEFMMQTTDHKNIVYLELLQHKWNNNNAKIESTWTDLDQGVGLANSGIQLISTMEPSESNDQYINELRFLRAFYRYWQLDFFRQVPMREALDMKFTESPQVWQTNEVLEWLVSELLDIIPELEKLSEFDRGRASKSAAQFLLAKIYLNVEAYTGSSRYQECLDICNSIIESGNFSTSTDYFSIFSSENTDNSEHIFVIRRDRSTDLAWFNFNPTVTLAGEQGGWNSARAVPDFVYLWDEDGDPSNGIGSDDMRFFSEEGMTFTGFNLGLLIGQQYFPDGQPIPGLSYTIDFNIPAQYNDGVRVVKYEKDLIAIDPRGWANNDIVVFRFSDVILMAAEAKFRLGRENDALNDVNTLRQIRNAPPLTSLSAQDLLDERAYELYWEGWRRQDLIRFDQFTRAWGHKEVSEDYRKVYPIPDIAFHSNQNLVQNPGY
jgi:hypothetical protein